MVSPTGELASAYVEVHADLSKFDDDLRGKLRTSVDRASRGTGRQFDSISRAAEQVGKRVAASSEDSAARVARSSELAAGQVAGAWTDSAGRARDATGRFARSSEQAAEEVAGAWTDSAGRARDATGRFVKSADRDINALGRSSGRLRTSLDRLHLGGLLSVAGSLGSIIGKTALVTGGLALVTGGLIGLAGGAIAVAGAVGQMLGLVAAVPAAMAVGGAAVAVFKLAAVGLDDAFSALADNDTAKFNDALANLAPTARAFALAVRDLKPELDGLRFLVQDTVFAELGDTLRDVTDNLLPTLGAGLAGIAREINKGARGVGEFLAGGAARSDIALILESARGAAARLAEAMLPAAKALLGLGAAGGPTIERIAAAVGEMANRFAAFIDKARASGELQTFLDGALDAAVSFGHVVGNVAGIIRSLFQAGDAAGGGLLATLERVTGAVRDFLDSAEGSAAMTSLFTSVRELGTGLAEALRILGPSIGPVSSALADLSKALTPLLPDLAELLAALLPLARPLVDLVEALIPAVQWVTDLATAIAEVLVPVVEALVEPIKELFASLGIGASDELVRGLDEGRPAAERAGEQLVDAAARGAAHGVKTKFGALADVLGNSMQFLAAMLSDGAFWKAQWDRWAYWWLGAVQSTIQKMGPAAALFGLGGVVLDIQEPILQKPFFDNYKPSKEVMKQIDELMAAWDDFSPPEWDELYGKNRFTRRREGVPAPVPTDMPPGGVPGRPVDPVTVPDRAAERAAAAAERALERHRMAMEEAGRFLADGLVEGLTGTIPQIKAAAERMAGLLNKALGTGARGPVAVLRADTKRLEAMAAQRDSLVDKLTEAQQRLDTLVRERASLYDQIADKVRSSFDLVPAAGTRSIDSLLRSMSAAVKTAAGFTADFAKLKSRGLSDALLKQLSDAGPIAGAAMARKLALASNTQLAALNKMSAQLEDAAKAAGGTVSSALFDSGIAAAKGLVAGLTSQQKAIEDAMMRIALAMQAAIKKALGIRSPSLVMAEVGTQVMAGLAKGVLSRVAALDATMRAVAGVVSQPIAPPPVAPLSSVTSLPVGRAAPGGHGAPGGPAAGPARAGTSIGQLIQHINLPTGDPEAAAQTVVNRIAAKVA